MKYNIDYHTIQSCGSGKYGYMYHYNLLQGHYAFTNNKKDEKNVFTFLASNSNVEWALKGNKYGNWAIGTLGQNGQAPSFNILVEYETNNKPVLITVTGFDVMSLTYDAHSHPDATKEDFKPSGQDQYSANSSKAVNSSLKFWLFMPKNPKNKWLEY